MRLATKVFWAVLLAGCSSESKGADAGPKDAKADAMVNQDSHTDSVAGQDAGCASSIGLKAEVACPGGSVDGHCGAGEACYGNTSCRAVPCKNDGFCAGAVSIHGINATSQLSAPLTGEVTWAADGKSFTVSDGTTSLTTVVELPAQVALPLSDEQSVTATTCVFAPTPTNESRVLVLHDDQGKLLLVAGLGADATKAPCIPAEVAVRRREANCQPFPAPPPDNGGFLGRFALEFAGNVVVGPSEAAKPVTIDGQTFDAHVFDAYWFIEWRGTGVSGAFESFAVLRK